MKGGTPAIENNNIEKLSSINEFWENSLNVYNVLNLSVIKLNSDQKREISDKLYINMYVNRYILVSKK